METSEGRVTSVRSSDGTRIVVEEVGDPKGKPVVLLHGIAQSRHVWRPLFDGRLPRDGGLRLIAMDMRGHGDSDAPEASEAYGPGRLGEDLTAVLDGLERPTVVAWSYGGVALGEYLRAEQAERAKHESALGGVLLLAAATSVGRTARDRFGAAMMDNARALMSDDSAVYERGARAFLAACPATPVPTAFFEDALAQMLRVPALVRRALLSRTEDFSEEIARSRVPLAIVHGTDDRVVLPSVAREAAKRRPDAQRVEMPGVGHLPWVEAPGAFEESLRSWLGVT